MERDDAAPVAQVEVLPQPSSATWAETWVNVVAPALMGVVLGALWQVFIQPRLSLNLPNPIQASLMVLLLVSPLMHRWFTDHEQGRWKEYTAGVLVLGLPLGAVWLSGYGGFICGGYLSIVIWIWVSTSWWRFRLPPFRSALWHTLGVNVGALGGSLMAYGLVA